MMEVQTRNDDGELKYFSSVKEAMDYASIHLDVWKISFDLPDGERVRLLRHRDLEHTLHARWIYDSLMAHVHELLGADIGEIAEEIAYGAAPDDAVDDRTDEARVMISESLVDAVRDQIMANHVAEAREQVSHSYMDRVIGAFDGS